MQRFRSIVGQEFVKNTKYPSAVESDQEKGLPPPPLERDIDGGKLHVALPAPQELAVPAQGLLTTMAERKTTRKFSQEWLTIDELAFLLWTTQGVKRVTNRPATLRTVPSAGARHPFETYLYVQRVEGLNSGIYRYKAIGHSLVQIDDSPGWADKLSAACYRQQLVGDAAVAFFWAADASRTEWRFADRAYRYIFLDAGHVCQNLYLACAAIGAGVCAVGSFYDDELNALLGLDGQENFVVYAAAVGRELSG